SGKGCMAGQVRESQEKAPVKARSCYAEREPLLTVYLLRSPGVSGEESRAVTSQVRKAPDRMSVPCLPRRRTVDAPRSTRGLAAPTAVPVPSGGAGACFGRWPAVERRHVHSTPTEHRCGSLRHGRGTS